MNKNNYFGVSLSVYACNDFKLDHIEVLNFAIEELGIKHFRLMSYWNLIEQEPGTYDFSYLDKQFAVIEKAGGSVSLCLGKRQPRWPECHMPDWALKMSKSDWQKQLNEFIAKVVTRYKDNPALISYQLENEALLKNFGYCPDGDYSRRRLRRELRLVKSLDSQKPVMMSLSNGWGLPVIGPMPDVYGMSLYTISFNNGAYRQTVFRPRWFKLRSRIIKLYTGRNSFIHELQAEPWGPKNNSKLSYSEQLKSMPLDRIEYNIKFAKQTGLFPIYLWGLEWWSYCSKNGNCAISKEIKKLLARQ